MRCIDLQARYLDLRLRKIYSGANYSLLSSFAFCELDPYSIKIFSLLVIDALFRFGNFIFISSSGYVRVLSAVTKVFSNE